MIDAAIYYLPSEFQTKSKKLMGRHSASESMLQAMAECKDLEHLYAYVSSPRNASEFKHRFAPFRPNGLKLSSIPLGNMNQLSEVGTLMLSDPNISSQAWKRQSFGMNRYSLCGITHTICSEGAMDLLGGMLNAPVQEWDAIICTSKCVKQSLENLWEMNADYLRTRFGNSIQLTYPQSPVIPLGVHTSNYAIDQAQKEAIRSKWRNALDLSEDTFTVLFFGRLSFHAKANPAAMCQALEKLAQESHRKIALIQAGWFANEGIQKAFLQCAKELCPSVDCKFLDGRKQDLRKEIWHVADVFMSLVDNIQETFGLTPLEAKSAGLPVIVSDWDGYRDTIRHQKDGFCIPTMMPKPGSLGSYLIDRLELGVDNYDMYIGNVSQNIAIDMDALHQALDHMLKHPDLCKKMGDEGARHAREKFDWSVVMKQVIACWEDLKERRDLAGECRGLKNPLREDPFKVFDSYPSCNLNDSTPLELNESFAFKQIPRLLNLSVHHFGLVKSERQLDAIIQLIKANKSIFWKDLKTQVMFKDTLSLERHVMWLFKIGALKFSS